jgi:hypothetical protein
VTHPNLPPVPPREVITPAPQPPQVNAPNKEPAAPHIETIPDSTSNTPEPSPAIPHRPQITPVGRVVARIESESLTESDSSIIEFSAHPEDAMPKKRGPLPYK